MPALLKNRLSRIRKALEFGASKIATSGQPGDLLRISVAVNQLERRCIDDDRPLRCFQGLEVDRGFAPVRARPYLGERTPSEIGDILGSASQSVQELDRQSNIRPLRARRADACQLRAAIGGVLPHEGLQLSLGEDIGGQALYTLRKTSNRNRDLPQRDKSGNAAQRSPT